MPARYTHQQIQHVRSEATSPRRLVVAALIGAVLVAIGLKTSPPIEAIAFVAAVGAVGLAGRSYREPRAIVAAYDRAHALWDRILDASDPKTRLTLDFPLRPGEVAYYSEMSTRFAPATGAARPAIPGSHVDPEAIPGARARFGPAGTVVYSARRRQGSRGTAPTGIMRVAPAEIGRLSITSQRFLFEGDRETIEFALDSSVRVRGIELSERIAVDHPDRAPNESFSVDPLLFNLCMVRRARDARFVVPAPPPPLGNDQALVHEELPAEEHRLIS